MTNNDELALKLKSAAENLKEIGIIHNYSKSVAVQIAFEKAASPANILALLAERDADKKRIAELEARTVCVKLPLRHKGSLKFPEGKEKAFLYVPHDFYDADDLEAAMKEAGIKLEVGE